jgi:RNA polymerase sigma factor (sigma-70 family)
VVEDSSATMSWDTLTGKQTFLEGLMAADSPDWHHHWTRFYQLYKPLIASVALKSGVLHRDIDDIIQDIFTELQSQFQDPNKERSRYRAEEGRFRPYLMRLVQWRVANRLGRSKSHSPIPSPDKTESSDDPFSGVWREEEERLFLAMAKARVEAPMEHLQIWDCLVEKQLSPAEVAQRFGKKRGHIDTIKHRVSEKLRRAVEEIRQQHGFA